MDARTPNRGMEGGSNVTVRPHRYHDGVFIAVNGEEDVLCTKNMVPGEVLYNDKIIYVQNKDGTNVEYRVWNHSCSTLAAAILVGVREIYIKPGARVLYLGNGSGTTVSHVSDIVGPNGVVYAVESSLTSGKDLMNMAEKRTNVVPVIEDAKHPERYRMLVGKVDVIFLDMTADIREVLFDQARILWMNAQYYLKDKGKFVMSIKPSCIGSRLPGDEKKKLEEEQRKLQLYKLISVQSILPEPSVRDYYCIFGFYDPMFAI